LHSPELGGVVKWEVRLFEIVFASVEVICV